MTNQKYNIVIIFTLLLFSVITAQDFRRYAIKSGTIEYELSGNASGTSTTIWTDWGRKEIQIQNTKTTILGITNVENTTTLMLGMDIYTWKEGDSEIKKSKNPISKIIGKEDYDENDLEEFSEKSLESIGYKKTGEESIDGKDCEVYEGLGGKLWIWKKNKLALKIDVNLLGMSIITKASKIELDKSIDASLFELPEGKEIVEVENVNYNNIDNNGEQKDINSMVKDLLKGSSSNQKDSSKNINNESDENFTEEVLEETKNAAVEGAKEGVKETAKDEAKKEAKKKVKSLLKSLF